MHLDVKPANIMVRRDDNRAILIDFGLSKHYDSESGEATSTTPVGVSHGFAPMEQYQDGGVSTFSPETDIYSLGATLYYLVTGNVPPQATVVAEQGLPQLGELSSNIREAIERSMSYLRKDRPHTIKEFLALLDNVEPVVEVLVADDERTKITAVTDDEKTKIVSSQPKVEQPKVQIDREPKLKLKTERPKRRWWQWLLGLLLIGGGAWFIFGDNKGDDQYAVKIARGLGRDGVYRIGDYYTRNGKEGVVFEVSDGGRHGKIVSLDETDAPWDSCAYEDATGTKTGANSMSDGKANTDKIMNRSDSEYFEAFVWCRKKGKDWYLPAREELKTIYNNKSAINSTLAEHGGTELSKWYWSSTEYDEFCAWYVFMSDCDTYDRIKDVSNYVRAVSAF
jgi:serine/threonine protein kinase